MLRCLGVPARGGRPLAAAERERHEQAQQQHGAGQRPRAPSRARSCVLRRRAPRTVARDRLARSIGRSRATTGSGPAQASHAPLACVRRPSRAVRPGRGGGRAPPGRASPAAALASCVGPDSRHVPGSGISRTAPRRASGCRSGWAKSTPPCTSTVTPSSCTPVGELGDHPLAPRGPVGGRLVVDLHVERADDVVGVEQAVLGAEHEPRAAASGRRARGRGRSRRCGTAGRRRRARPPSPRRTRSGRRGPSGRRRRAASRRRPPR